MKSDVITTKMADSKNVFDLSKGSTALIIPIIIVFRDERITHNASSNNAISARRQRLGVFFFFVSTISFSLGID